MYALMHIVKLTLAAAAFALIAFAPNPAAAQTPASTTAKPLVVSGSSTIYPLMIDIAQRFQSANAGVTIEVRSGGTGRGIADVRAQLADIAMVSRPLADNERDLFSFAMCRDGAAVVVHRSNPVKGLNAAQLADILTGNVTDWKQLGGRPGAVKVAWRTEGQAIPELLLQHLKLKSEQIRSHATFFENADAVRYASRDRNAISVAALAVAERGARSGGVKILAYEGVAASTRTVRDHTYPLSRPLLLVTRTVPTGLQKRLVDFATSSAVADLHEKHGFVTYQE